MLDLLHCFALSLVVYSEGSASVAWSVKVCYLYHKECSLYGRHKPLALTSDLAPGPLMVDFKSNVSLVMRVNAGSIETSLLMLQL